MPDLVPARIPARAPAAETSWQGVPAQMTRTGVVLGQFTMVMSPRFGALGYRWARTFAADCFCGLPFFGGS